MSHTFISDIMDIFKQRIILISCMFMLNLSSSRAVVFEKVGCHHEVSCYNYIDRNSNTVCYFLLLLQVLNVIRQLLVIALDDSLS